MNLNKSPKFNLSKGDKINLTKDNGVILNNICMGANWSAIDKVTKSFFGGSKIEKISVDLDASCTIFDKDGNEVETISFSNQKSKTSKGFISHSGDDLTGDMDGDDGLDNEVIEVNLSKAPENSASVWFYLNSFSGQDFGEIPNVSLRIYEGTPSRVDDNFAQMILQNDATFSGKRSVVLGKLYVHKGKWKFESVGTATNDLTISEIIDTIKNTML
jgi:tellurium resistance protein TerZ